MQPQRFANDRGFVHILQFLMLLMISSDVLSAQAYKWVDQNGQIHYGEKPPQGADSAREMKLRDSDAQPEQKAAAEQRLQRMKKRLRAYDDERQKESEEIAKAQKERQKRSAECKRLGIELRDLKVGGTRYYELDDQGKRVFLSDHDIKARVQRLEKYIDRNCP